MVQPQLGLKLAGVPALYEKMVDRPAFTTEDARQASGQSEEQLFTQLSYLVREGYLQRVKKRLYVPVPLGQKGNEVRVNPHVLASKLAPRHSYGEYVLLYHAALELHGVAHSRFNEVHVGSPHPFKRLDYQGVSYIHTRIEDSVLQACKKNFQADGQTVYASDREWTFAFTVMHPNMAGGLEETLRSLAGFSFMDAARLLDLGRHFKPACYYNRVGFVLSLFEDRWEVPDLVVEQFKARCRHNTDVYAVEGGPAQTVSDYNIRVPAGVRKFLET